MCYYAAADDVKDDDDDERRRRIRVLNEYMYANHLRCACRFVPTYWGLLICLSPHFRDPTPTAATQHRRNCPMMS